MAMVIANFTGAEADELRRAMSFHRSEVRMQKASCEKLRSRHGQDEQSSPRSAGTRSSNPSAPSRSTASPRAHAISFGLLAYSSTWMKAHRAVEFYTALLNNQPMGFYSPATLLKDAKTATTSAVRPVCVTESDYVLCTVDDDTHPAPRPAPWSKACTATNSELRSSSERKATCTRSATSTTSSSACQIE